MRARSLSVAAAAAALVLAQQGLAVAADDPSTTVTYTVTSGALTLSVPASANLGSGAPGTTISAPIGPVTVTDDRALLSASWTVTAAETDFTNDGAPTIPATDATYDPGTITTTGTITATGTSVTLSNSAQTVVTGTDGVGDNTASWNPTVAVHVPAGTVGGTYTGTLTQSVA
ncbi:WxL domain-containing protein [Streptomyces brasiliensis]|uniref:WxL domain-containing protein n=1 Tax=Streptomyces brasiliensis TaxID=1954 RepID=UPI0016716298|nr:WxL domain-containing protein [Streptomyces brasiliensis]